MFAIFLWLGPSAIDRSQQISIDYAKWVLIAAEDKQIRVMGPAILSGIFKILRTMEYSSSPSVVSLRSASYSTISIVSRRLPLLFPQHFECK